MVCVGGFVFDSVVFHGGIIGVFCMGNFDFISRCCPLSWFFRIFGVRSPPVSGGLHVTLRDGNAWSINILADPMRGKKKREGGGFLMDDAAGSTIVIIILYTRSTALFYILFVLKLFRHIYAILKSALICNNALFLQCP